MIIFFTMQLDKLWHLLPINTDNPLFTFAFSNKTSGELWFSSQPSWLQGTSTLLLDSLYLNQFGVLRSPALPVVTLLIYYLCHFCAICHRKCRKTPEVNFTWNFVQLHLSTEYNVFNAMFWGLLKCVSPTIWFNLCECGCVSPPMQPNTASRIFLPSECTAPPPWYLCHYSTQECVFLFVAIPTWQGEECACVCVVTGTTRTASRKEQGRSLMKRKVSWKKKKKSGRENLPISHFPLVPCSNVN